MIANQSNAGSSWISRPVRLTKSGFLAGGQTGFNQGQGFWLGLEAGQGRFSAGDGQRQLLCWDGEQAHFSGDLAGYVETAAGDSLVEALEVVHDCLQAPLAGFGVSLGLKGALEDGGAVSAQGPQTIGSVQAEWVDANLNTRRGRLSLRAAGSGGSEQEGLRVESSGAAAMVGFFGAAAGTRQTVTGSRAGNAALASLLQALASYGLIVDSTSA